MTPEKLSGELGAHAPGDRVRHQGVPAAAAAAGGPRGPAGGPGRERRDRQRSGSHG